mgnify:CR=1 FL=1
MDEIDFTIVTPSYNYSNYIRECIESVLLQEGVKFEHIVFDACSNDGSTEILREYDHLDLTVEKDSGMTEAINKGFRKAKGKWVMWLNADDRLLPGSLSAFLTQADKHEDSDIIYGAWNNVDSKGDLLNRGKLVPFYLNMFAHSGCYIASTSTFYRRSTTIDAGIILNEDYKYVMDGEFYCRLSKLGKKFSCIPNIIADFRVHGENLSLGFGDMKDASNCLKRQYMGAESIAIRRTYGITLFKNWHLNAMADCILYYFYKILKQPLKWFNSAKK